MFLSGDTGVVILSMRKLPVILSTLLLILLMLPGVPAVAHNATAPGKGASNTWYLAEGSTGEDVNGYFETFILLANPGSNDASVTLTYQLETGSVATPSRTVAGGSRMTVNVKDDLAQWTSVKSGKLWSVSTKVDSSQPIVAERSQYWTDKYVLQVKGLSRQAGTECIGVTTAATNWYLAEGSTHAGSDGYFETWILVQNPGPAAASVMLNYQTPSGQVPGPSFALAPGTRRSVSVGDTLKTTDSISTQVTSDNPVVAERAMYWSNPTIRRISAHDSVGVTTGATTWYMPACYTWWAGYVVSSCYVLVQNPGDTAANITLSFVTTNDTSKPAAPVQIDSITLGPKSRHTFLLQPQANGERVSFCSAIVGSDIPIIAEKSYYVSDNDYSGSRPIANMQATGSNGLAVTSKNWLLAEGSTATEGHGTGFATLIWIMNPGTEAATINVTLLMPGSQKALSPITLQAGSMTMVSLWEQVGSQWSVSTKIESDKPVATERTMEWADPNYREGSPWLPTSRGDQTSSIGVPVD